MCNSKKVYGRNIINRKKKKKWYNNRYYIVMQNGNILNGCVLINNRKTTICPT